MKVIIKSAHLKGEVTVPASKSECHRQLICAALADKPTEVFVNGICSDIEATSECISALGAGVTRTSYGYIVEPIKEASPEPMLCCRDSGSTLRFLIPIMAALGVNGSFSMEGRLPDRPLHPLDAELSRHGVTLTKSEARLSVAGKLSGNCFEIPANVSSQFVSGILMALPLSGGGTLTMTGKIESSAYISLTIETMRTFGIDVQLRDNSITVSGSYKTPGRVTSGGDWSAAAFWICAGALSDEGIRCLGIDADSTQGDKVILNVVTLMGAEVSIEKNSVFVRKGSLDAVDVDATDVPDLVPVIAAVASTARGTTVIRGAARLRLKESDRLNAMNLTISALGGDVEETCDGLILRGTDFLNGGSVDTFNDHRIAMSAAVASMSCMNEVIINDAQCVSKSYPAFWDDVALLGGEINVIK